MIFFFHLICKKELSSAFSGYFNFQSEYASEDDTTEALKQK